MIAREPCLSHTAPPHTPALERITGPASTDTHPQNAAAPPDRRTRRYPGYMTIAPHGPAIHRLVDQLAPEQAEALYVLLRGMVSEPENGQQGADTPMPHSPAESRHRFAFIGIMDGEPDLADRSAQILREELGNPAA